MLGESSMFFEISFQSSTVAELINEVIIIGGFKHIDVSDDVGWCFEVREYVDLIEDSFFQFRHFLELVSVHHFDGDFLLGLHIECTKDDWVSASANLLLQIVIFNDFSHNTYKIIISHHQ